MSRIIPNVIVAVEYKYHYYNYDHAYTSRKVPTDDSLTPVLEYEKLLYSHDGETHDFLHQGAPFQMLMQ